MGKNDVSIGVGFGAGAGAFGTCSRKETSAYDLGLNGILRQSRQSRALLDS
jgi:hypothetical protein